MSGLFWKESKASSTIFNESCRMCTQMLHGTGMFTYIYRKFMPNVGKYSIHGAYGTWRMLTPPTKLTNGYPKIDMFRHVWMEINMCQSIIFHSPGKLETLCWTFSDLTIQTGARNCPSTAFEKNGLLNDNFGSWLCKKLLSTMWMSSYVQYCSKDFGSCLTLRTNLSCVRSIDLQKLSTKNLYIRCI